MSQPGEPRWDIEQALEQRKSPDTATVRRCTRAEATAPIPSSAVALAI